MSTVKRLMHDSSNIGYFEDLTKGVQEIVKELLVDAADESISVDLFKRSEDAIDSIECHSRDGFIAWDHNRGGFEYSNFTCIGTMEGSGYFPKAKASNDKVSKIINASYQESAEIFFEDNEALFKKFGITIAQCTYRNIEELEQANPELKGKAEELSELECSNMSDENSTVMYNLRFMYHGKSVKGLHSASVSAALNFEAPYHRPGREELAKEIEITWRNVSELKRKLRAALKKTVKEVF